MKGNTLSIKHQQKSIFVTSTRHTVFTGFLLGLELLQYSKIIFSQVLFFLSGELVGKITLP